MTKPEILTIRMKFVFSLHYLFQPHLKSVEDIGDTVTIGFCGLRYSFVLKGFAEEPVCGSSFTDGKFPYVNRKDFDEMFAEVKKLAEDSHDAQLCLF